MSAPKIHKYSSHVAAASIMPDYVRDQYQREGLRGTLCGYMRPSPQVPYSHDSEATAITCKLCLREKAKAA
ncbi:hypothetical protein [Pseudomonas sp. NPDC089569]|uniref:hypothetical protein n=1 Tax=Pseudomonas sp. NPDC089569 TaxID=3390722 RepID=UPI003D029708